MIDDYHAAVDNLPTPGVVRVHVGLAILMWIENLPPAPVRYDEAFGFAALSGIPFVYDKALHPGAWQGKDSAGEVVASGQIGDPDALVWYVPGQGFLTYIAPAETAMDFTAGLGGAWL